MFPLIAIGGVIGAMMSIGKGASWVADQLNSSSTSASAGGKADATSPASGKASAFEAALSAQVAGQKQPAAVSSTPIAPPVSVGTDYDAQARMKAGLLTYSHIGDQRDNRANAAAGAGAVASAAGA